MSKLVITQCPEFTTELYEETLWKPGVLKDYEEIKKELASQSTEGLSELKIPIPNFENFVIRILMATPKYAGLVYLLDCRGGNPLPLPISIYREELIYDSNFSDDPRVPDRIVTLSEFFLSIPFAQDILNSKLLNVTEKEGWLRLSSVKNSYVETPYSAYYPHEKETLLFNPKTLEVRFVSRYRLDTSN